MNGHLTRALVASVLILGLFAVSATAQDYRAYWVDTFNTTLNNHDDVLAVVSKAKVSNANAIFAQVRRRGDSWYLNSLEPPPDFVPIAASFDPLQDLISEAHAAGIEVHAFVIMGAIWNKNPNFSPTATLGPPTNPNHAFNLHGGYDPVTRTISQGPNNWLTRSLIPDGTGGIAFQGHRVGAEFWLDFGHPDAAANSVDVLMHLVRNYDLDGLHLDRIRYPEIGVTGQTRLTGANIGYNQTSIERFQRANGLPVGSTPPPPGDALWAQWRRDQVTNVVRRIYLNAIAIKPHLKISAALIAFGGAPAPTADWTTSNVAEAYWRVYQDWRAWTDEGILDIAIPMNYKREHIATQQTQFNQWLDWTRTHKYGRAALIGQGAFVNGIEGTLRQVRRSLEPDPAGNKLDGVVFFSMATSNVFTNNGATTPVALPTPYSIPPGQMTPTRPFAEFASGLTTGKSVDGATLYEDPIANPLAVFSFPAPVPVLPWKVNPQVGHLKGFVKNETGAVVDTGAIRIERQGSEAPTAGRTLVTNATDGGGFYGGVDLAPGTFRVTVTPVGAAPLTSCPATVTAGAVTTLDITIDRDAPTSTIVADVREIWPANGKPVTVTISGDATDAGTGVTSIAFRVIDEYGEVQPLITSETAAGAASLAWSRQIQLQASRLGEDQDGRTYTIEATITDGACHTTVVSTTVVVAHDQGRRGQ